jgi:hypothetical protein
LQSKFSIKIVPAYAESDAEKHVNVNVILHVSNLASLKIKLDGETNLIEVK